MATQTKLCPAEDGFITCYKFRGIRTDCAASQEVDLSRIEDILKGNLYCADWRRLNDVLEGKYYYGEPDGRASDRSARKLIFGERLQDQKEAYKVCSLTTDLTNPLMWAFYASENAGVATTGLAVKVYVNVVAPVIVASAGFVSHAPPV